MKLVEKYDTESEQDDFFKNFNPCDGANWKSVQLDNKGNVAASDHAAGTCNNQAGSCNIPSKKINVEGEFTGGFENDSRPIAEKVGDYCHGGSGEAGQRAADAVQALAAGLGNLIGSGDIIKKEIAQARGGSANYVDQPTELIKSLSDKLRQTRDRAFYVSQCGQYTASFALWQTITTLESVINAEIQMIQQELELEIESLGIADVSLSLCILSIVVYLLLIVVDKK
jgi:hypothetical protein